MSSLALISGWYYIYTSYCTPNTESYSKGLVEACSKPRVESVYKIQSGMFIFTNSVVLTVELEVIKQWLKKTTSLSKTTEVESCLPQSRYLLKALSIIHWNSNTYLPITPIQITAALSSSLLFKRIILVLCFVL